MLLGIRQTRWLAALALLAVLARLAMAVACAPGAATGLASGLPGGDGFVICTSHGLQTPTGETPADPASGTPTSEQEPVSHCEACTLAAAVALSLVLDFAWRPYELTSAPVPQRSAANRLADHLRLGGIRSRAPPLPA